MFRTRFRNEIVAEFLPPPRPRKIQRLIILCDGMPSIPHKQPLCEFLAAKGYWVLYPRYRGAWESGGQLLEQSPHRDILDIVGDLPKEIEEIAFKRRFRLAPDRIFAIGGSFGGAAAILASLDARVSKVIANCPVLDWTILDRSEKVETSNESYNEYIREAFGNGYRLSNENWDKLKSGTFYSPWRHRAQITASKVMISIPKTIRMCLTKEAGNSRRSRGCGSSLWQKVGTSARTTSCASTGPRSRSS